MPHLAPNVTVSESDYVNVAISTNTAPSWQHFSERNGLVTTTNAEVVPGSIYEVGHDDVFFQTSQLSVSLKELMNRIYQLEIEVHELKQGGTIKL